MAKVIEFYIPNNFRKALKWVSAEQRGKIIEFAPPVKKIGLINAARSAKPDYNQLSRNLQNMKTRDALNCKVAFFAINAGGLTG